jgi:hypothetical protein
MERYKITITGEQPLLHHQDSIEWADVMDSWRKDEDNKKNSKAGDDRSPAWRWLGSLYHDGTQIIIPTANIMRSLMEAGAMMPVGTGKKTYKAQTQSGILPDSVGWPLLIDGKPVPVAGLLELVGEKEFAKHQQAATDLGFGLFLKRARIGDSKHVRVRPKFDRYSASGMLTVTDEQISRLVLERIVSIAGRYKGIGDWRPGGRTPGSYGMFSGTVERI